MAINVTPIPRLTVLTVPAFTLGTANAAGSAATSIASDSTLLMFDAVAVDAITFGQVGAVGTATVPPRRDHAHAMADVTVATQAEMEAASSSTVFVTPGRTQYHPGVAKAHVSITGSDGSSDNSYNTTATSRGATGVYTWSWDTDFNSVNSGVLCSIATTSSHICSHSPPSATAVVIRSQTEAGAAVDADIDALAFGEQVDG